MHIFFEKIYSLQTFNFYLDALYLKSNVSLNKERMSRKHIQRLGIEFWKHTRSKGMSFGFHNASVHKVQPFQHKNWVILLCV